MTTQGILVLGAPRSGTTLLRRLLDAHPNIACPGETYLFGAAARFLRSDPTLGGLSMDVVSGLGFLGFDKARVLARLRDLVYGFHAEHAQRVGKPRWASKSATDAFYLDAIERLCGDSITYLCLVRHGLDVVTSLQDLTNENGAYLAELHGYIRDCPRPLEAFAKAWVDATQGLQSLVERRPGAALLVRYEDLVADADAEMARILKFLGEAATPDLVAKALGSHDSIGIGDWRTYRTTKIERASVERWRALPRPVIDSLAGIVNPTLVALGYDAIAVGVAENDADARRRYELGLLIGAARAVDRGGA